MIVPIPEDIYCYEHKVWGNFTKRQLICCGIALAIIAPIFISVFWKTGSPRLATLLAVFAALPVLICGVWKKDGQYIDKVLWYRYRQRFKYPQKRKFVMSNLYETIVQSQKEYELAHEIIESKKQKERKKGHFKCPFALAQKGYRSK